VTRRPDSGPRTVNRMVATAGRGAVPLSRGQKHAAHLFRAGEAAGQAWANRALNGGGQGDIEQPSAMPDLRDKPDLRHWLRGFSVGVSVAAGPKEDL
jgi:hypothetical protein